MNYWFHNRVELRGDRLNAEGKELPLSPSDSGETVTLSALDGPTIAKSGELLLQGRGYPSPQAALDAGLRWRHYLTDAFAHLRIPIDVGPDDQDS